ncbi:hypothetical protein JOQ06_004223 [Pogonophryne albipinna]|uniref:TIR domain-containing protein n=1 Tax=Pogonophryne albipinna TaxID=1090488 RepID=A0AAD6A7I5_9TELE|nr:hypothetical protein JOQ06_004223 [Pogonophryne albipinna]
MFTLSLRDTLLQINIEDFLTFTCLEFDFLSRSGEFNSENIKGSEEELFVLSTLRSVLENELGYSVCIFDRDSLPGGTITDETLSFVSRSRRLLVVLGPGYASRGSQALLELQVGLDSMARGGQLRVILGDKSRDLTSRFWKRLRVELPVRRGGGRGEEGGKGLRLQSQNSTNSQTGLITNSIKHPQKVFQAAA